MKLFASAVLAVFFSASALANSNEIYVSHDTLAYGKLESLSSAVITKNSSGTTIELVFTGHKDACTLKFDSKMRSQFGSAEQLADLLKRKEFPGRMFVTLHDGSDWSVCNFYYNPNYSY